MTANILLTTSQVLTLDLNLPEVQQQESCLSPCYLRWRQGKLWIDKDRNGEFIDLPALKRKQWLIECLKRSSLEKVCLDLQLEETEVKIWADACQKAKKPVFLRIPSYNQFSTHQNTICWGIKRVLDWTVAAFLLLVLSPLMLLIALAISISSPGPIFFRQFRVGKRGQLFPIFKFRTMVIDAEKQHHQVMGNLSGLHKRENDPRITPLGRWLRKYSLDELPQLLNVLRGEMSLVGPRPWALYDALRLEKTGRRRLNALPGITGAWQVKSRSQLLDLEAVTKCDLNYLYHWSLGRDLKILLLTVPRVVSGFGAY